MPTPRRGRSRRWFLGALLALATGGAAAAYAARGRLYTRLARWLDPRSREGSAALDSSDVAELVAFTGSLAGVASDAPGFADFAATWIRRAAARLPGVGLALRRTARLLAREAPPFHELSAAQREDQVRELLRNVETVRMRRLLTWIKYREVELATDTLLRIGLRSPQAWARVGYRTYPGMLRDPRAYLEPLGPVVPS